MVFDVEHLSVLMPSDVSDDIRKLINEYEIILKDYEQCKLRTKMRLDNILSKIVAQRTIVDNKSKDYERLHKVAEYKSFRDEYDKLTFLLDRLVEQYIIENYNYMTMMKKKDKLHEIMAQKSNQE